MRSLIYSLLVAMALCAVSSCRGTTERPVRVKGEARDERVEAVRALCRDDSSHLWAPDSLEMPGGCVDVYVRHCGNYAEVFNDSNYVHWADAERCGLRQIEGTADFWHNRRGLEKVVSCRDYYVDRMRYSEPYLVPGAAAMLHEIGRRFRDTLQSRGGGDYRIKVTSVLRTPQSVRRLRRVNSNSVDSSVHTLGTTIDISYARFICDNPNPARNAEQLKGILAEVLLAMRDEGWCWVKYERKQPCFHISYRGLKD